MSHEKSATYEIDGKHYVVNTAGFRSDKAALNATFSKKNKKRKRPTSYKTDKEGNEIKGSQSKWEPYDE